MTEELRTCRRCGDTKPLETGFYLHQASRANGQPYRAYRARTCKQCAIKQGADRAAGGPRSRQRKATKVRADGHVWCPRCVAYLPPQRFRTSTTSSSGYGTYCADCSLVVEKRNRTKRFSDPVTWARKLAYERAYWAKQQTIEFRERKAFVRQGLRTLRSKGLNEPALERVLGVTQHTLYTWRTTDRLPSVGGEQRVALALKVTMDLPVIVRHTNRFATDPALTALVMARMEAERGQLRPMRSRWRNREAA